MSVTAEPPNWKQIATELAQLLMVHDRSSGLHDATRYANADKRRRVLDRYFEAVKQDQQL